MDADSSIFFNKVMAVVKWHGSSGKGNQYWSCDSVSLIDGFIISCQKNFFCFFFQNENDLGWYLLTVKVFK